MLSKIISISTGVPDHMHKQSVILDFMTATYKQEDTENRKLRFLYKNAGIEKRYSVIADYSNPMEEWSFFPSPDAMEPFPSLEKRMQVYKSNAAPLCIKTIQDCIAKKVKADEITHLITVSCTGMSAPGLDLEIVELMGLKKNIHRSSVNFMGCYAALHALKMADGIIASNPSSVVVIVCLEFCTLHFQKEYTNDNILAGTLFADGCAAVLIKHKSVPEKGLVISNFYSEISEKGKKDMAWELSSSGFLMTLTSYISDLVEENFDQLVVNALNEAGLTRKDISHWCIHPGGKKILQAIEKSTGIDKNELIKSYEVLNDYGNMSSPTILFVLKKHFDEIALSTNPGILFGAAFGPGITMETFIANYA